MPTLKAIIILLLLLTASAEAAPTAPGSDMTLGYMGLNYSSNPTLQEEAGNPARMQSGVFLKWSFAQRPIQPHSLWGFALLASVGPVASNPIATYGLDIEGKYFFGDQERSGWFLSAATGLAMNFEKTAIVEASVPGVEKALPGRSGRARLGANLVLGTGYSLQIGEGAHLGIGPGLSLWFLPGGVVPAVHLNTTFFY